MRPATLAIAFVTAALAAACANSTTAPSKATPPPKVSTSTVQSVLSNLSSALAGALNASSSRVGKKSVGSSVNQPLVTVNIPAGPTPARSAAITAGPRSTSEPKRTRS